MSTSLASRSFWEATIQRCVRVFAAALLALVTADGFDLVATDWKSTLSTAALAPIATLLFCIAGDTFSNGAGPAFGSVETTGPSNRPGEGGYGTLGLFGVVVLAIALILLVVNLLSATLVVGWVFVAILAIVGVVLLVLDNRGGVRRF